MAAAATLAWTAPALAFTPFTVRDIRVQGLQRTEAGTVFGYLPLRVGDELTPARASEAIKALYATGFFKDVQLAREGEVLVVRVEERPAIASVDISGSREFDAEALKKALRHAGLAEARIFDRAVLERAEQEIRNQYLSRGKYSVKITASVTPLERNRVAISLAIDEGANARIAQIRILGSKVFSEETLLDQLKLTTPNWLSWYTKTDQYSREKLAGDLETLRSFYLNRGYLEFGIESTQVSIDPAREKVYVTLTIKEGERYRVRNLRFGGNTLGRDALFRKALKLRQGDVFSGELLSQSEKQITDELGAIGYAFANVHAVPTIDRDRREVDYTLNIDPGRRAYVRRITIAGNQRTRDEVIRRELRQFEGAWFDAEKIALSRDRVERLGYFQDVQITNVPVPGVPDQVDLLVKVTERATGNVSFGAGYSTTDRLLLMVQLNEPNFLGTGNTLAVEVNTGQTQRTASISYINPYFTQDGVSLSTDLYSRTFNALNSGLGDYRNRSSGFGLRWGIPYTELDRLSFGVVFEQNQIKPGSGALPRRYTEYINQFGYTSDAWLATLGWSRDSRDSALAPTRGRLQRANLEVTFPGQDMSYSRTSYQHIWYTPITKDYTFALSAELGYGKGFNGKPYPVFKNFYAGGINSVRGFSPNTLGPRDVVDNLPLGGNAQVAASAEILFPLPGTGNDKTVRAFLFADAGNVFEGRIRLGELRYSMGAGINWLSPIGPLKLSLGYPLKRKPGDDTQRVQFEIGSSF
ncbi:MAG: outer membrane protein assembly factor BamA [Lautropia sp.]|nr:outer membrane protein assembly factor BamA [Lautropia sp.]